MADGNVGETRAGRKEVHSPLGPPPELLPLPLAVVALPHLISAPRSVVHPSILAHVPILIKVLRDVVPAAGRRVGAMVVSSAGVSLSSSSQRWVDGTHSNASWSASILDWHTKHVGIRATENRERKGAMRDWAAVRQRMWLTGERQGGGGA